MRFALFLILVVWPPASIVAQAPTIPAGTRVKVETHQRTRVAGTLMSQTRDSIIVAAPGAIRTVVASEAVTRIAVSKGRSRVHGALRGMRVGSVVIGGGTAVIMTVAFVDGGVGENNVGPFVVLTAIGAAMGAIYGGTMGVLFPVERWFTVYSASSRVSVGPFQGSVPGVGVSIRF